MKNIQLSKNFYLNEFTFSRTAIIHNIPNIPDKSHIANLRQLCVNVLQPLRDFCDSPILINSGFRSFELNKLVGGVAYSSHLSGCAADIVSNHYTSIDLFVIIKDLKLNYDVSILEFDSWVHVSYNRLKRNISLIAQRNDNNMIEYIRV